MLQQPAPLQRVAEQLQQLPGIGPKTSQRLVMHLMTVESEQVQDLGEAILDLRNEVGECEQCFNYSVEKICPICSDPSRDQSTLCVVERPTDVFALERSGEFNGIYHVLGGVLSPVDGVAHEDLHIDELTDRIDEMDFIEVIFATSPTVEGDATAEYLRSLVEEYDVQVTRLALGLPVGSDLDYADQVTIARALRGRGPMNNDDDDR